MRALDYVPSSHSAKDLLQFLETYPRDELFQIDERSPRAVRRIGHAPARAPANRLYVRPDDYGRFLSCLVYLPRDGYTTAVRLKIESILKETFGGISVEFTTRVTESVLARLHFVVHVPIGQGIPAFDEDDLQERVAAATRSWTDEYARILIERVGEAQAPALLRIYDDAFPESYKEDFDPATGVNDTLAIEQLEPAELNLRLYAPVVSDARRAALHRDARGPGDATDPGAADPATPRGGRDRRAPL